MCGTEPCFGPHTSHSTIFCHPLFCLSSLTSINGQFLNRVTKINWKVFSSYNFWPIWHRVSEDTPLAFLQKAPYRPSSIRVSHGFVKISWKVVSTIYIILSPNKKVNCKSIHILVVLNFFQTIFFIFRNFPFLFKTL